MSTDRFSLDPAYIDYKGVWVFVEQERGHVHPVSWELLGEGKRLAQKLGVETCAVVMGYGDSVKQLVNESFFFGADKVYHINDPILEYYRNETYSSGLISLVNKYKPEIIIIGATTLGRDLAGAIATHLKTGLTADCTGLEIDEARRHLLQTRPAFGGNIMATILTPKVRPQMSTVRPRVFPLPHRDESKCGEIIEERLSIREEEIATKVLDFIPDAKIEKVNLQYADIIVSGGFGLKKPENFGIIKGLADALGGVVGASRKTVDSGWIGHDHQVGQTGVTVRPRLYIACGISGAIQHRVGMQGAECIVAINKDPDAPIFDIATYGIVGDVFKVVPLLTKSLKERLEWSKKSLTV